MSKPRITSIEEAKKRLKEKWGDEYEIIDDSYKGTSFHVDFVHTKCGNTFSAYFTNVLKLNTPCKYCSGYKKKTTEEYAEALEKVVPGEWEVVGEYINAQTYVRIRHRKCGTEIDALPSSTLKGTTKCPYCNVFSRNRPLEVAKRQVSEMHNGEYRLLNTEPIIKNNTVLKMEHIPCGYIYTTNHLSEFKRGAGKCPICERINNLNTEIYKERIRRKYGDDITVISEFKTVSDNVTVKHEFCGTIFDVNAGNFMIGELHCPACSKSISYPERFVKSLLKELGIDFVYQFSCANERWCGRYRYDFYLPSLLAIIEVHGSQHYKDAWQSVQETADNDAAKRELAIKNGIAHYIEIDAYNSDPQHMRESILASELTNRRDL